MTNPMDLRLGYSSTSSHFDHKELCGFTHEPEFPEAFVCLPYLFANLDMVTVFIVG